MSGIRLGSKIKSFQAKSGQDVTIRYVRASDLKPLLDFANELVAEDTYVQLSGRKVTYEEEKVYLTKALADVKAGQKIHIVAISDRRLVGSAEIRIGEKRKSHVGNIGISVLKKWRGAGIGQALMETLITLARGYKLKVLYLTCFSENYRAIHVYEKMGFRQAGTIPDIFQYKGRLCAETYMYLLL